MSRLPVGGFRELGVVNWVFSALAARVMRLPRVHLFTTLGQHKRLFWSWLPLGAMLLGLGKLRRRDTELVILRVGHLRGCEYELQQHRRIALRRGIDTELQAKIFEGPGADGLSDRDAALLTATDEIIETRTISPQTWQWLSRHLERTQLIEFVTLAGQYDALAATISALEIPLDFRD
ncbi:carboxymuconolactone decarboxylase family protein [Mycobacterium sp.]|uniref:carboxymuconolactone decarboxylase family protein n=1 Tax=Mycobacterium sp. TaxID=1785 RepID=UPI002D249EBF|nr:carboxymuconolactone decarboxylase family protein [Mycobacterium sp.]HZA11589.1 carboxymuconolactone decarboxylase family protein [Mycobacterium sp.]